MIPAAPGAVEVEGTGLATRLCIYCGSPFDPRKGKGDHILHEAMGEFGRQFRFRGACNACNQRFGRGIDQEFVRCGLEAAAVRCLEIPLPPKARKGTARRAAYGVPPPIERAVDDGLHLIVRQTEAGERVVADQICVIAGQEQFQHELFPDMPPERIAEWIDTLALDGEVDIRIRYNDALVDTVERLQAKLWSEKSIVELAATPGGMQQGIHVCATISPRYYRAVAKMAFHYYLWGCGPVVVGDETEFNAIRAFVCNEDSEPDIPRFYARVAVSSPVAFACPYGWAPGGKSVLAPKWMHLLAADDAAGIAVVYLRLFVGPNNIGIGHHVILGPTPEARRGRGAFAHRLQWVGAATSITSMPIWSQLPFESLEPHLGSDLSCAELCTAANPRDPGALYAERAASMDWIKFPRP